MAGNANGHHCLEFGIPQESQIPEQKYFDLVKRDSKRVIFVDNIDPNRQVISSEKQKAAQNNAKMCQKILDRLNDSSFQTMSEAIPLTQSSESAEANEDRSCFDAFRRCCIL